MKLLNESKVTGKQDIRIRQDSRDYQLNRCSNEDTVILPLSTVDSIQSFAAKLQEAGSKVRKPVTMKTINRRQLHLAD